LEDALLDLGFTDVRIMLPQGYWRKEDVYRWEAYAKIESFPTDVHIGCWDTVTKCVRQGFTVEPDGESHEFIAYAEEEV